LAAPALLTTGSLLGDSATPIEITATGKVNVYDLPTTGVLASTGDLNIDLKKGNQSDPIFVFRMPAGSTNPIRFGSVTYGVKLRVADNSGFTNDGLKANNIFWVSNQGMFFTGTGNELAGNFIGNRLASGAAVLRIVGFSGTPQQVAGGRFLGFRRLLVETTPTTTFPAGFMTAMTTTDQPLLVPILQLHSPKGTPSSAVATAFGGDKDLINDDWQQRAVESTFNAAFIMGDSPSRPFPSGQAIDRGESGGGLHNFPRFLETWDEGENTNGSPKNQKNSIISGSFIQFKRSIFATAPFETVNDRTKDNSLFFDGAVPDYMTTFENTSRSYLYRGGANRRKAPFYKAPNRQWGYDVGFLSQTPDLFSRRFATPTAGDPNEFFREVGRDDAWVKALLCAAEKSDPTDPTADYDTYAVNDDQRPAGNTCPNISQYQS
jgi:hypothetical protein